MCRFRTRKSSGPLWAGTGHLRPTPCIYTRREGLKVERADEDPIKPLLSTRTGVRRHVVGRQPPQAPDISETPLPCQETRQDKEVIGGRFSREGPLLYDWVKPKDKAASGEGGVHQRGMGRRKEGSSVFLVPRRCSHERQAPPAGVFRTGTGARATNLRPHGCRGRCLTWPSLRTPG